MSMVTLDTNGARTVLDALDSGGDERAVGRALDANAFQIDYYSTHIDEIGPDEFRSLLQNPDQEREHEILDRLREGFERASDRPKQLLDQLASLDSLDIALIERDVGRYLPSSVELDATVHATVDGFNGGFHYRGDVGISILDVEPDQYPPKLRHELHHAGVRRILDDTTPYVEVMQSESAAGDCLGLLFTLLKEGLAIHYAQGGLGLYETVPAGADRITEYRDREMALFDEIEGTLLNLLETEDATRRKEFRRELVIDREGVLPPTHYIGTRMVATMDQYHARSDVIACIEDPAQFLPRYQRAARQQDGYVFDSELADRVTRLVD